MYFTLSQYEFKDSDSDDWHKVSESFFLDKLVDELARGRKMEKILREA